MPKNFSETNAQLSSSHQYPNFIHQPQAPIWQKINAFEFSPGLYFVATPIGHLLDISLRGLIILEAVDLLLCEDTRVTKKLLQAYGIKQQLLSYHEHNANQMRPKIMQKLQEGQKIALVSDAGMPMISDPGYKLLLAAREENIYTSCIPGPSAAITGLALSGIPTNMFHFVGFLPQKKKARTEILEPLKTLPSTLILYESANRIQKTLDEIKQLYGNRQAAITRELTKKFETILTGSIDELIKKCEEAPLKGEVVLVIEGNHEDISFSDEDIQAEIKAQSSFMSKKELIKHLQAKFQISRNEAYDFVHFKG